MIRYSHVALLFVCETSAEAHSITTQLGAQPTRVEESKVQTWSKEEGHRENASWTWVLDSPKTAAADVPDRLWALADLIEPFAHRLPALKATHKPWIDVLFHNTPQHPHGITGEFFWLQMPVEIMRRFSHWDLRISYEVIWFDHPDWVEPKPRNWLSRMLRRSS